MIAVSGVFGTCFQFMLLFWHVSIELHTLHLAGSGIPCGYFLAVGDTTLRHTARMQPGTPVISLNRTIITMESPSRPSLAYAAEVL